MKKSREIEKKQQLDLERDLKRLREKPAKTMPDIAPPKPEPAIKSDLKWTFQKIELTGADLLSESRKKALTEKYLNHPIPFSKINDLLNDIMLYYFREGYITTKIYIPTDQNIGSGELTLAVVEGKIEEILKEDESDLNLFTAFPFLEGKTFNLRNIEQGLDQINRLSSNNATVEILPGSKEGYSRLLIKNKKRFPLSGSLSYDNTGSEDAGKYNFNMSLALDNPFLLNDSLMMSGSFGPLSHTEAFNENAPNIREKASRSGQMNYSIPFGYTTLSCGISRTDYSIPILLEDGHTVFCEGNSVNTYGTFDRMLFRDQTDKLNAFITFTRKSNDNYFEKSLIEVSSRKLVIFDAGMKYETIWFGGLLTGKLTYSVGTKLLGAKKDEPDQDPSFPTAQHQVLKLNLSYYKLFDLGDIKLSLLSDFNAQYTDDVLYGSEKIYIGGLYSVRGFHNVSAAGDRGWYLQNTFTINNEFMKSVFGLKECSLAPFTGYDMGQIFSHHADVSEILFGGLCGINFDYQWFKSTVSYMFPLFRKNNTFNRNDNEYDRILLNVSVFF